MPPARGVTLPDGVCFGDVISLFSEQAEGFVYATQSSAVYNNVAVHRLQSKYDPVCSDLQTMSFEIVSPNRHQFDKLLRKATGALKGTAAELIDNQQRALVAKLKEDAAVEEDMNVREQQKTRGTQMLYGQFIQLKHQFTKKYLHLSSKKMADVESTCMKVELQPYNAKHAVFRVMPRFKVKSEGDVVQVGDQIVLESVKSGGQFLHVSSSIHGEQSVYHRSFELNLSVSSSGFTIYRRYGSEDNKPNTLVSGSLLRLFHKQHEAYLCAEGLFDTVITQNVHLRVREIDYNRPDTVFASTSAINYWQLEHVARTFNGCALTWQHQFRIRNMVTRHYLDVDTTTWNLTLSPEIDNPTNVFRLIPVTQDSENVQDETVCRIQHVLTGNWLNCAEEIHREQETKENGSSFGDMEWTTALMKRVVLSAEMQFADAFIIQTVKEDDVANFNFMAGMVPFLQHLCRGPRFLSAYDAHRVQQALEEAKEKMANDGTPNKQSQKLLRNLRIIELLVQVLQTALECNPVYLSKIHTEIYHILHAYTEGASRKNELYLAKHIDFFLSQIGLEGDVGLSATHMAMELIRDNRKIVDRITKKHIKYFVKLLKKRKNYHYLDLLAVLCYCDNVCIPSNQKAITEYWLTPKTSKPAVFHTELGQAIGMEEDVVYVSIDKKKTWYQLDDFATQREGVTEDQILFLEHQLDLMEKICRGKNEFAIKVITEELRYLTFAEAYLCLTNDKLPDGLRAKYCDLINTLFIRNDSTESVADQVQLVYPYNPESGVKSSRRRKQSVQVVGSNSVALSADSVHSLQRWVSCFLEENQGMTASKIGRNQLIQQVLSLVTFLMQYGYYNTQKSIEDLMKPMLNLLDGRNDKPFESTGKMTSQIKAEITKFQMTGRYENCYQNGFMAAAKLEAMAVLDLTFTILSNKRLKAYLESFTDIHQTLAMDREHPLASLLETDCDWESDGVLCQNSLECLEACITDIPLLSSPNLTSVLLDIARYEYDFLNMQAIGLLDRQHRVYEGLFLRAEKALIVCSDNSIQFDQVLGELAPLLKSMKTSKLDSMKSAVLVETLDKMTRFCYLDEAGTETHPVNQQILGNHGVVGDLLDLLSQDVDYTLMDQYRGMRKVMQRSCTLLKAITKNNETVQSRLFDSLDFLLGVKGCEGEMGEIVAEIFTGNKNNCLKVDRHQLFRMVGLVTKHTVAAPQLLYMLKAVVKVEELDLPLKRNQDYVMKYFTQDKADIADILQIDPAKRRACLLRGSLDEDVIYILALVDMLAACAEGEHGFIESLCQTMLQPPELLAVVNDKNIDYGIKRVYLRFFHYVYITTGTGLLSVEEANFDDPNSALWVFFDSLSFLLNDLRVYATQKKKIVQHLLRRSCFEPPEGDDLRFHHAAFHYAIDGVVPFLQGFFRQFCKLKRVQVPERITQIIDHLALSLLDFGKVVVNHVLNVSDVKNIVSCLQAVIPCSTLSFREMDQFVDRCNSMTKDDLKTDISKKNEKYYSAEMFINHQFNTFAGNFRKIFGGKNDLRTQIGFPSDQEYQRADDELPIPLGREFQAHVACFIDATKKTHSDKYGPTEKLIRFLGISYKNKPRQEKQRIRQRDLENKCLLLLRAVLHNEIAKLPVDYEQNPKQNRRALENIMKTQDAMNEYETMPCIMQHLGSPSDAIVREVLGFLNCMLFNGNKSVQDSLFDYFQSTREERFFISLKNRLHLSALSLKERKMLQSQNQAQLRHYIDQIKTVKDAIREGRISGEDVASEMGSALLKAQQTLAVAQNEGGLLKRGSTVSHMALEIEPNKEEQTDELEQLKQFDEEELEKQFMETVEVDKNDRYADTTLILVLKVMASTCDGQNTVLQDYFRDQFDNYLSCNMVAETCGFLVYLYGDINPNNVGIVTQVLQTLVEFASGNHRNQHTIFDCKINDYLDYILGTSEFVGCTELETLEVQWRIGNLLRVLTEENSTKSEIDLGQDFACVLLEGIDKHSIWKMINKGYDCFNDKHLSEETRKLASLVGFQYFHILGRMIELRPDGSCLKDAYLNSDGRNERIWEYFFENTMSIEVVKDDELHKVSFPVLYKKALREEVKEKFNYDVSREASERINDFMDWAPNIKTDIFYTRGVLMNRFKKVMFYSWKPLNIAMIVLSFIYAILISITWEADPDHSVIKPVYRYPWARVTLFVLGIIHVALTAGVVASYFIINRPTFPKWSNIKDKMTNATEQDDEDDDDEEEAQLANPFFSFKTFWIMSLLCFSVAAVVCYGYFFAFHLLHMAQYNQMIKRAISSVTKNGAGLVLILLFGIVIFFIFAQLNFAFYRELFESQSGLYCTNLYECFTTVYHRGFIVSHHDAIPTKDGWTFDKILGKAMMDLAFFIIITTIGLNIIFGIIVDTFAQLRDSKWQADHEMKSSCFICGEESHAFEKKPGGFENHVKNEHNQWAYIFFFMHLEETQANNYTALELYVSRKLTAGDHLFFPNGRALCLEVTKDDNDERLKYLEEKVGYLVSWVKANELSKVHNEESQRQLEWESDQRAVVRMDPSSRPPPGAGPSGDPGPGPPGPNVRPRTDASLRQGRFYTANIPPVNLVDEGAERSHDRGPFDDISDLDSVDEFLGPSLPQNDYVPTIVVSGELPSPDDIGQPSEMLPEPSTATDLGQPKHPSSADPTSDVRDDIQNQPATPADLTSGKFPDF